MTAGYVAYLLYELKPGRIPDPSSPSMQVPGLKGPRWAGTIVWLLQLYGLGRAMSRNDETTPPLLLSASWLFQTLPLAKYTMVCIYLITCPVLST